MMLHPAKSTMALAALLVLSFFADSAKANELPAKTRVTVLLTTLSYDLNIKSRGDALRIGVVGKADDSNSVKHAKEALAAFEVASSKRVKGMGIVALDLSSKNESDLAGAIKSKSINILYLSSHLGPLEKAAIKLARDMKILTLSGQEDTIKAGAAIGAVMEQGKPKILVNLKAAEAQGAKLDARLLRLVRIVN
ncbi:MAG: YfiR family protein [Deltaproteobacteria bacterium]|nr:YfiR family protein [Deltaproteobacteria bacterium]